MGYSPAFPNALFGKPLLNQCIAIIQRDQASAIALVNPALASISEFHKGPGVRTAFPWLTLAVDSTAFDVESPYTRASHSMVLLSLDVGQFDQEIAQDNAQDYGRVLDMILTSASGADWITSLPIVHETVPGGMTTPSRTGAVKMVFIASHRYSRVRAQAIEAPVLNVMLEAQFDLQET